MGIPYKVCRSILIWIFENKDLNKVLSTLDILGQLGTLSYILIFTFPNVPEIVQPAFFRKIHAFYIRNISDPDRAQCFLRFWWFVGQNVS